MQDTEHMTDGMKTALYYRVSTDDQTVQPQQQELRAYAQQRGWTVVAEFTDVVSGSKSSRVSLDLMMNRIRQRDFDLVMVVKLDRLARSLSHFAQLVGEFDKHGVALVCPGQGIDTSKSNPAGRLQMHVLAAVAEFERSLIVERTKAGLAAARARGVRLGKPSSRLPANHLEIARQWLSEEGSHLRELATRLGGVSVSTAFRIAQQVRKEVV
jgi:DNA invertase Pin-like site-specific DNA recombinase